MQQKMCSRQSKQIHVDHFGLLDGIALGWVNEEHQEQQPVHGEEHRIGGLKIEIHEKIPMFTSK